MAALNPGLLGGAPYSAAKAASLNMIRGMNTELAKFGVRACAIMPGEVDTPILENRPRPPDAEDRSTMMQAEGHRAGDIPLRGDAAKDNRRTGGDDAYVTSRHVARYDRGRKRRFQPMKTTPG